jgi:hypothetical protein
MNEIITIIIKIISIIIIVIIFGLLIKNYLYDFINNTEIIEPFEMKKEDFEIVPYNTRILYNNRGELPWNRHTISSSVPYDITVKEEASNAFYYEFNNADYELKLKEIFKNKCEELIIATDGNKWSKWIDPKILDEEVDAEEINKILGYYDMIFNIVKDKLNNTDIMDLQGDVNNPKKIQIVHDILNKYRYNIDNKSYYIFDIEMILYRAGKLQGKHIKLIATTNGVTVNIIVVKIIGVISEDNIVLYPYTGTDILNKKNMEFDIFTPTKFGNIVSTETDYDTILSGLDKTVNSEVEQIMYDKLLKDYNEEDADKSNIVLH